MSNRPGSPIEVASRAHPAGCTCGCLHTFPKALYRDYRGEGSVFTGILELDSNQTSWKLNDPNLDFEVGQDMTGTGHKMEDMEFILDVAQYHADPKDRFKATNAKDIQGILKDFSDKPSDFEIKPRDRERFATIFPHGIPGGTNGRWTVPQIRAEDLVKVTVQKYIEMANTHAREHCWVHVLAVTQTGMITGCMANDIESPLVLAKEFPEDLSTDPDYHLHEGDLVSFPVTCVFGVEHGKNWG